MEALTSKNHSVELEEFQTGIEELKQLLYTTPDIDEKYRESYFLECMEKAAPLLSNETFSELVQAGDINVLSVLKSIVGISKDSRFEKYSTEETYDVFKRSLKLLEQNTLVIGQLFENEARKFLTVKTEEPADKLWILSDLCEQWLCAAQNVYDNADALVAALSAVSFVKKIYTEFSSLPKSDQTMLHYSVMEVLQGVLLQLADEEIMSSYIKERETPSTSHDFISLMSLSFRSTWSVYRDIEQRLNADKR